MARNTFIVSNKATLEQSSIVCYLKNPNDFTVERYKVSTLTRIANADMVGDMVARKYKFNFKYSAILASELNRMLEALWDIDGMFFYLWVPEGSNLNSRTPYRVYAGAIPSTLHYGNRNPQTWVWKDVSFSLIQQ